jgi:hypothetical protein
MNESALRVTALDAVKNVVAWTQGFEGTPASDLFVAGEMVGLITMEPYRILLFEAETGKRVLSDASYTRSQNAQVRHVSEDLLILQSEGRFLEAYDLPAGTLRWRVSLQRMSTRAVEVGPAGLAILGTQRTPGYAEGWAFLSVVNLKSGKIVRMAEKMDLGVPYSMILDGERAYVLSREADRSIAVRAVKLADLSVEWKAAMEEKDAEVLRPLLAKDHVIVGFAERGLHGKYAYGACVLDKAGRRVQNIKSEHVFERPPEVGLANGRLVFSVDNRVEVHR